MSPAEQRAAVVAEALTWLGTPWAHAQRVKGAGVDCANLVIGVYAGAGLIEAFDPPPYPRDWHVHRSHEWFLWLLPGFPAREIAEADAGPGDLVLFRIGRVFSHAAIVLDWPQGLHAAVNEGAVVRCDLARDVGLTSGPRKVFTYEGWCHSQRVSAPHEGGGGDSGAMRPSGWGPAASDRVNPGGVTAASAPEAPCVADGDAPLGAGRDTRGAQSGGR